MTPAVLYSARQSLHCLAEDELALLAQSPAALACVLGLSAADDLLTPVMARAAGIKCSKLAQADLADLPWFSYWLIVDEASHTVIGVVGFKGPPDIDGEAEIGYGIAPAWRSQGRMAEAAAVLIEWAFADARCLAVTARGVRADNLASKRVLMKLGMALAGSSAHGLDYRLERR